jgi:2-aminobenzoylacetyl-CoA thioesterase
MSSYRPGTLTPNFYLLGTPLYPAYLSLGKDGMIIEGGITATARLLEKQVKDLGIDPERIKYIVLTHTHSDHIGAIPHLRKVWPHVKVIGGAVAAKILKREEAVKEFKAVDRTIIENLLIRGEISEWPQEVEDFSFQVDQEIKEGEQIDLGNGIVWTAYETPGHSSCHVSYHSPSEEVVVIGDATGLFDPVRDIFWPNYFNNLESYCNSIRKLAKLPASTGVLCHNYILGDFKHHFQKAMKATENFHNNMMARVAKGEDPDKVVMDVAKWTYSFTNLQPFQVIHDVNKLMLKRSMAAAQAPDLFKFE